MQVPGPVDSVIEAVIKSVVALAFLMAAFGYTTLAERKILGRMQSRPGPNRVGPLGLMQPLADGLKLLLKEQLIPREVNLPCTSSRPVSPFCSAYGLCCDSGRSAHHDFRQGTRSAVANVNIGLLYILAVLSLGVYGIVLGSWSSGNRYSPRRSALDGPDDFLRVIVGTIADGGCRTIRHP
jgi:NADH-quinone oxidoreductase subunit H